MSQKTYMYDTQWTALINAIQGGDPTAIVTALGDIKDSIDAIETALGSLSTDVTQDATQWTNLINAISSGGGGGGGNVTIDSTQWTNLLTSIDKGDTSALTTALGLIKTSVDSINTSLGSLSVGVSQNATQWANLVNAITNQSITVDLSNITSDVVSNESTVTPADTVTQALDVLKSDLTTESKTFDSDHLRFDIFDKFVIVSGYYTSVPTGTTDLSSYFNSDQMAKIYTVMYAQPSAGVTTNAYLEIKPNSVKIVNNTGGISNLYFEGIYFRNK